MNNFMHLHESQELSSEQLSLLDKDSALIADYPAVGTTFELRDYEFACEFVVIERGATINSVARVIRVFEYTTEKFFSVQRRAAYAMIDSAIRECAFECSRGGVRERSDYKSRVEKFLRK